MTSDGARRGGFSESPARAVLLIIMVGLLARLIASHFVGLGTDESYSIAVARDLRLSYFDHPPAQYWLVHLVAPLFGYGRGARWPFILMFAASSWLMFALTRRMFGARAGAWAVLALSLSVFFTVPAASWVLPDGPLILGLLGATTSLARLWFPEEGEAATPWRDWLIAGFWIGVAGLSKYQAALFGVGVVLAVLSSASARRWLARPHPYAAALVAVAMLSPVLVWNAQHQWASFAFQAGRGAPSHGLHPIGPLEALLSQAGLMAPWIFIPMILAVARAARAGRSDQRCWFLLMLAAPTIMLFTITPLFGALGLPHWPMPGWLLLYPLLGAWLEQAAAERGWPWAWRTGSALALAVIGLGAGFAADTGAPGAAFPKTFKHGDPTQESIEWTQVRAELERRGQLGGSTPIIAVQWSEAGKLGQALGDRTEVLAFTPDPREFGLRSSAAWVGRDAVIVGRLASLQRHAPELGHYFQSLSWSAPIAVGRQGRTEIVIGVIEAHRLLRPYPRPAFAQP